jgi:hypothetical protein
MTPQEETVILEARDILGRYLSQNPVIGSWQALDGRQQPWPTPSTKLTAALSRREGVARL